MQFIAVPFEMDFFEKFRVSDSVCHVEAPKLTEIDFSSCVRLLSICLRTEL